MKKEKYKSELIRPSNKPRKESERELSVAAIGVLGA